MNWLRSVATLAVLVGFSAGCSSDPYAAWHWRDWLLSPAWPCEYGPYPGYGLGMGGTACPPAGCADCGPGAGSASARSAASPSGQAEPAERSERSLPQTGGGSETSLTTPD